MDHRVQHGTGSAARRRVPLQGVLSERVLPGTAALLGLVVLAFLLFALLLRAALLQARGARRWEGA